MKTKWLFLLMLGFLAFSPAAWSLPPAPGGGGGLPWETPLQNVQQSLTVTSGHAGRRDMDTVRHRSPGALRTPPVRFCSSHTIGSNGVTIDSVRIPP